MRVLLTIADLSTSAGGPSRSLPALADALAARGHEVEVLAQEEPEKTAIAPRSEQVRMTWVSPNRGIRRLLGTSFAAALHRRCLEFRPDVLHDNGVWLPSNRAACSVAREHSIPLLISPRGMLRPWALRRKRLKKALAWVAYQRQDLQQARCIVATSEDEAAEIRALGLRAPVAVVPHGVDLPPERPPRLCDHGPRVAIFIARLVPNKGLLTLADAWARIRPPGWILRVVGPDDEGHGAEVRAAIVRHGIPDAFEFIGELDEEAKWRALADSDLFILPSLGENFGLAIAEALAAGLPVITTRRTPWAHIRNLQIGWCVEPTIEDLAEALRQATSLTDTDRQAWGHRGRRMVEEMYSWRSVALRLESIYAKACDAHSADKSGSSL